MNSRPDLKIDWASAEAARYACEKWHYSKCVPVFKCVRVGVWENEKFIGVVIFSNGAAPQSHCPYGIQRTEICELTRVALASHVTPVTRIISIALRFLRRNSPRLKLIVSYADPEKGHHGGIYAGGGWVYAGRTSSCEQFEWTKTGERVHTKTIRTGRRGYATQLKENGVIRSVKVWKHKYLMPLDDEMRRKIEPLRKPYPKRVRSVDSDTSANHAEEGGANPTRTLLKKRGDA